MQCPSGMSGWVQVPRAAARNPTSCRPVQYPGEKSRASLKPGGTGESSIVRCCRLPRERQSFCHGKCHRAVRRWRGDLATGSLVCGDASAEGDAHELVPPIGP